MRCIENLDRKDRDSNKLRNTGLSPAPHTRIGLWYKPVRGRLFSAGNHSAILNWVCLSPTISRPQRHI